MNLKVGQKLAKGIEKGEVVTEKTQEAAGTVKGKAQETAGSAKSQADQTGEAAKQKANEVRFTYLLIYIPEETNARCLSRPRLVHGKLKITSRSRCTTK